MNTEPTTTIVVKCARCGSHFSPTPRAIKRGTWQRCHVCNPSQDDERDGDEGKGRPKVHVKTSA